MWLSLWHFCDFTSLARITVLSRCRACCLLMNPCLLAVSSLDSCLWQPITPITWSHHISLAGTVVCDSPSLNLSFFMSTLCNQCQPPHWLVFSLTSPFSLLSSSGIIDRWMIEQIRAQWYQCWQGLNLASIQRHQRPIYYHFYVRRRTRPAPVGFPTRWRRIANAQVWQVTIQDSRNPGKQASFPWQACRREVWCTASICEFMLSSSSLLLWPLHRKQNRKTLIAWCREFRLPISGAVPVLTARLIDFSANGEKWEDQWATFFLSASFHILTLLLFFQPHHRCTSSPSYSTDRWEEIPLQVVISALWDAIWCCYSRQ